MARRLFLELLIGLFSDAVLGFIDRWWRTPKSVRLTATGDGHIGGLM